MTDTVIIYKGVGVVPGAITLTGNAADTVRGDGTCAPPAELQATLVSATNIKTINGSSVLGSGDLPVAGAAAWGSVTGTLSAQTDLQGALDGKQVSGSYATGAQGALADTALQSIANGSVTLAKQANVATATVFYRKTAGTGVPEVNALATLKTDLALVKADVGLSNADNTTDAGKPVSTAQQTALDLKANITSQTLVTPVIGVATGTSLAVTGLLKSSGTAGVGYATGAGGTVTQATNKATGVTLDKLTGAITMNAAALAAAAEVSFIVTNNTIAATDAVIVNHASAGTAGAYVVQAHTISAGAFRIMAGNMSAGSLSEAIVIRFTIIKGVSA